MYYKLFFFHYYLKKFIINFDYIGIDARKIKFDYGD